MILYLKPRTKRISMIMAAVILLVLGARVGRELAQVDMKTQAEIRPILDMETNQPHVGLVIEVSDAKPIDVTSFLSLLEKLELKATWFFPATLLESQKEAIKEIQDKAHEFGFKGTEEKPMDRLAEKDVKDRLKRAREAFDKIQIEPCPFFYAPQGRTSDALMKASFEEGLTVVKGNIDGKLIKGKPQDIDKKAQGVRPGDILIVHLTKKGPTPDPTSFESFAASVKSHGLSLVTLSILAKGIR